MEEVRYQRFVHFKCRITWFLARPPRLIFLPTSFPSVSIFVLIFHGLGMITVVKIGNAKEKFPEIERNDTGDKKDVLCAVLRRYVLVK